MVVDYDVSVEWTPWHFNAKGKEKKTRASGQSFQPGTPCSRMLGLSSALASLVIADRSGTHHAHSMQTVISAKFYFHNDDGTLCKSYYDTHAVQIYDTSRSPANWSICVFELTCPSLRNLLNRHWVGWKRESDCVEILHVQTWQRTQSWVHTLVGGLLEKKTVKFKEDCDYKHSSVPVREAVSDKYKYMRFMHDLVEMYNDEKSFYRWTTTCSLNSA